MMIKYTDYAHKKKVLFLFSRLLLRDFYGDAGLESVLDNFSSNINNLFFSKTNSCKESCADDAAEGSTRADRSAISSAVITRSVA
jgi:hypothetical protein